MFLCTLFLWILRVSGKLRKANYAKFLAISDVKVPHGGKFLCFSVLLCPPVSWEEKEFRFYYHYHGFVMVVPDDVYNAALSLWEMWNPFVFPQNEKITTLEFIWKSFCHSCSSEWECRKRTRSGTTTRRRTKTTKTRRNRWSGPCGFTKSSIRSPPRRSKAYRRCPSSFTKKYVMGSKHFLKAFSEVVDALKIRSHHLRFWKPGNKCIFFKILMN